MAIDVRIKQKSLFKKKLGVADIVRITGLSYGICDENYRLIQNETAKHTLIYDPKNLARGIDLSIDGTDIVLNLSLPTTLSEIKKFYEVIELICKEFKTNTYIREGEKVIIEDNSRFINSEQEGSIYGLKDIQKNIASDKNGNFIIFGVYNPISLGFKELEEIDNDLDKFEKYLHRIQSIDAFYAAPRVYQFGERLVGVFAVGQEIPTIIPTKPYIIFDQVKGIEEWYVVLGNGTPDDSTVKYEDFINNINSGEYYDANHIIVNLKENDIKSLLDNHFTKI